jgi:hypothetical protein
MAPRARSPVLGYNHNLRHGGRVFHVQTEDSGQSYARVYTHLFFEGTILSSKKAEYDPAAAEDIVRGVMQQLHKTMIRELTHGGYDPHIAAFFGARGEPARLEAPATAPAAAPATVLVAPGLTSAPAPELAASAAAPAIVEAVVADAQPELPVAPPLAATAGPTIPPEITPSGLAPSEAPAPRRAPAPRPKPVVVVKPSGIKRPPVVLSSSADGVVVRRNVVINVGAGVPPVNGSAPPAPAAEPPRARSASRVAVREGAYGAAPAAPAPAPAPARAAAKPEVAPQPLASSHDLQMPWETPGQPSPSSQPVVAAVPDPAPRLSRQIRMPWDPPAPAAPKDSFAGELVSDKSLDEVILEYLSDDAEPEKV